MNRDRVGAIALPVIGAVYPVLALAAGNWGELNGFADLKQPLLISLGIVAIALGFAAVMTRDWDRRSLVALLLILYFAGYSAFTQFLSIPLGRVATDGARFAPYVSIALLVVAILAIQRWRRRLSSVRRFATTAALAVLLFPLGTIGYSHWVAASGDPITAGALPASTRERGRGPAPDIFLIVLDKYTGSRSLLANYGFDNSRFLDFLRSRGFYVPARPRSNYVHTFLALASMLNWRYLDDLSDKFGREESRWSLAYPLIENNRTSQYLQAQGYQFVFLPTPFHATSRNPHADLELKEPAQASSEFFGVWLRTTALSKLLIWGCRRIACGSARFPSYTPETTTDIDWKFEQLSRLGFHQRPQFVFAHLLVPHEPYIYDENCNSREPLWPLTDHDADSTRVKHAYIAQLKCVNSKVEELIDTILTRSRTPPVIVLQADHGHGRDGRKQPPLRAVGYTNMLERTDIFEAYLVPPAVRSELYDTISPVNLFRSIFRGLFGADLKRLPDATFWSSSDRPYDFTRVYPDSGNAIPRPSLSRR